MVTVGLPVDGKSGLGKAGRIHTRQPVVDEAAGDAVGLLPRVAFDLDAQRAAVVRPGPCMPEDRDQNQEKTSCRAP